VRRIVLQTYARDNSNEEIIHCLIRRLEKNNFTTLLKVLMIFHKCFREGDPMFMEAMRTRSSSIFALKNVSFLGADTVYSLLVRKYAKYLEEKVSVLRVIGSQFEKTPDAFKNVTVPIALKQVPKLQSQFNALLNCRLRAHYIGGNMLIISVMMLLLKDTVPLYPLLTKGVMWLLDKFTTLSRSEAEKVLEIYRLFVRETDALILFYDAAKGFARNLPEIQKANVDIIETLQKHIETLPKDHSSHSLAEDDELKEESPVEWKTSVSAESVRESAQDEERSDESDDSPEDVSKNDAFFDVMAPSEPHEKRNEGKMLHNRKSSLNHTMCMSANPKHSPILSRKKASSAEVSSATATSQTGKKEKKKSTTIKMLTVSQEVYHTSEASSAPSSTLTMPTTMPSTSSWFDSPPKSSSNPSITNPFWVRSSAMNSVAPVSSSLPSSSSSPSPFEPTFVPTHEERMNQLKQMMSELSTNPTPKSMNTVTDPTVTLTSTPFVHLKSVVALDTNPFDEFADVAISSESSTTSSSAHSNNPFLNIVTVPREKTFNVEVASALSSATSEAQNSNNNSEPPKNSTGGRYPNPFFVSEPHTTTGAVNTAAATVATNATVTGSTSTPTMTSPSPLIPSASPSATQSVSANANVPTTALWAVTTTPSNFAPNVSSSGQSLTNAMPLDSKSNPFVLDNSSSGLQFPPESSSFYVPFAAATGATSMTASTSSAFVTHNATNPFLNNSSSKQPLT
jgi:hypothetical protein